MADSLSLSAFELALSLRLATRIQNLASIAKMFSATRRASCGRGRAAGWAAGAAPAAAAAAAAVQAAPPGRCRRRGAAAQPGGPAGRSPPAASWQTAARPRARPARRSPSAPPRRTSARPRCASAWTDGGAMPGAPAPLLPGGRRGPPRGRRRGAPRACCAPRPAAASSPCGQVRRSSWQRDPCATVAPAAAAAGARCRLRGDERVVRVREGAAEANRPAMACKFWTTRGRAAPAGMRALGALMAAPGPSCAR